MSPATVTENEGKCKTSESVQYPLFTGLGVGGGKEPHGAWREGLGVFHHGCGRTLLCDSCVQTSLSLGPGASLGVQMVGQGVEGLWG